MLENTYKSLEKEVQSYQQYLTNVEQYINQSTIPERKAPSSSIKTNQEKRIVYKSY